MPTKSYYKGELKHNASLTNAQAREIRETYNSNPDTSTYKLAKKYGVSQSTIYKIIRQFSYVDA